MRTRDLLLAGGIAVCLVTSSCKKIQQGQSDPSKFASAIPLEYGHLVGATTNSLDPRWVTLWFEKADKTIVIVGVDQHTWKAWTEPQIIERR